ncbi:MAG: EAL domain-containing protein [Candidatus Omnitrophica bacterium]|nr:EAL domain-containing protein [Candidatus Omnitrophota bacterium]
MGNKHILLVDDDVGFAKILGINLQAHSYSVTTVHTGKDALEKAKLKPDLILLDIVLPDITGYEVCHKLRQNKATSRIPIVILTAKGAPREKVEALHIGADDYITKPFQTEELIARVESLLRRSHYFQEEVNGKPEVINEIKEIIENGLIIPHFQPIFSLKPRKLLGLEVLSRPMPKTYFSNTEVLFSAAFRLGMLFDLEMACHKKALAELGNKVKKNLVFFNISPYIIQDPKFRDITSFYKPYSDLEAVVFELTERIAIEDFDVFLKNTKNLKKYGFKIAIDDIGSGYASLNSVVELKPDFIKIDIHLIHDIHIDPVRQNLLKAIMTFCKDSGITAIAEGIEKPEELETIIAFGVNAAQGYFLGRPNPNIEEIIQTL